MRATEVRFLQWQSAQTRLATRAVLGNTSLENLTNAIEIRLGISLAETILIPLPDGAIALQWDSGSTQTHSPICSWGTGGQSVYISREWPEVGALHLLLQDANTLVWDWALYRSLYFTHPYPSLPPDIFQHGAPQPDQVRKSAPKGTGAGLIDLLGAESHLEKPQNTPKSDEPLTAAWARFWAAMLGLQLIGNGWSGTGAYLPEWQVHAQPIGGLAFNLARSQVKAIPTSEIELYSAGVPAPYHTQVGHVHLPWDKEQMTDLAYQFIVRNPNSPSMSRTRDLVILTANFWEAPGAPSDERQTGLACVAEYLQRMGHAPNVQVQHGNWHQRLGELAKSAPLSDNGGAFALTPQAWETLAREVLPSVLHGEYLNTKNLAQRDLGPDWSQILPPMQE
ncbi:MAG: hypothetical protein JXB38_02665 [Anaerolineales bacterium]|nr:hypothetical protein [Anaerolineales bacterium]